MTDLTAQRQGQPLLFLGLLLTGWCLVRVLTWQNPWPEGEVLTEPLMLTGAGFDGGTEAADRAELIQGSIDGAQSAFEVATKRKHTAKPRSLLSAPDNGSYTPDAGAIASEPAAPLAGASAPDQTVAAILSSQPVSRIATGSLETGQDSHQRAIEQQDLPRWRLDAWALLREGGGTRIETGIAPASYGASQVGGVLAYRIAPSSRYRPAAYLRASRALVTGGETEGAFGLRARPFAALPLDFHVEARVTDRPGDMEVRPAAFVAGGIDRANLPAGLRLRGYGQAGYVHGGFATAFADGKLVAEREFVRLGSGSARLGAGAWGAAQKGASRLDLGPTLALELKLGETPVRLEADYRFRIAGNAEPGDGGVLTLSTGF